MGERERCECGWLRPLIAVTSLGTIPRDVFPVYLCPQCAAPHVPKELSQTDATATVIQLLASLRAKHAS